MPEQLALFRDGWENLAEEFRRLLKAVVDYHGLKTVAYQLGVSDSHLSHALAARNKTYLRADWVPWLIYHAPGDEALEFLANLRDRALVEKKPLTPEEQLQAIERAMEKVLGPVVRDAIWAEVRQWRPKR